ncbi:MAG: hypothetical protein A2170_05440, partial [Deltaproteobacteria bacterium RBG_13_53_10]
MTMDFKPIEIQDKPLFDEFLGKDPPQVSELTFTNVFIWRRHYQPTWVERNGCILIIFRPQKGPAYGLCPFGPGDKKSALDVLCQEIAKQTIDVRICRVGEEFVTNHVDPAKYEVVPDRDNSDYIYLAKDLINLSGNKYHRKKNHLNQFIKNHAFEYHPLNAELVKRVLGMQEAWCQIRECVLKPDLLAEDFAVREALTHFEELGYQGGAVLINSVVEAFSLGEPLNEDTAVIHIEKANPDVLGLYAAINQLFCLNAWSRVTYI